MFNKNLFRNAFATLLVILFLQANFSCNQSNKPIEIPKEGGSVISYDLSKRLIDNFQQKYRSSRLPFVSNLNMAAINQLLKDSAAANIRIYYGEEPRSKTVNLIAVAANNQGVDMVGRTCILITRRGAQSIPVATAALYTHQFQKDYQNAADIPYAEKFNRKLFTDVLFRKPGVTGLQVYLGNDADEVLDKKSRKVKMIIFAVNAQQRIIFESPRTGQSTSVKPAYLMASYSENEDAGVENGQQCLSMCNINSSPLYTAQ